MITGVIYPIHRAVERPLHFKGFQGPYILLAAGSLIGDLLLFVLLYIGRVPPWLCVSVAFGLGSTCLLTLHRLSHRFGAYGLEDWLAARDLPRTIHFDRRNDFIE